MSVARDALIDEIALRRASIADARSELANGELSREQFDGLERRENDAIARCEQRLAELDTPAATSDEPTSGRRPRRHRRAYLATALACFAAAAVVLVFNVVSPRQPGSSDTGGISTTKAQQIRQLLREAEIDQVSGANANAIAAYNNVLSLQAKNVEALTQSGWLYFSAGSAAKNLSIIRLGEQRIATAVSTYPRDPDPRMYYAIIAATSPNKRSLAITQFRKFLTLHPTAVELAIATPYLKRLGIR